MQAPGHQHDTLAAERVLAGLVPMLGSQPSDDVRRYILEGHDLPVDDPSLAGPCFAVTRRDQARWVLGFSTDSFADRTARGVVANGPAHAAGLRDGASLLGWSIYFGDATREVELNLKGDDGRPKTVRYRPVDGSTESLPYVAVAPDAAGQAACRSWIRATPRPPSS